MLTRVICLIFCSTVAFSSGATNIQKEVEPLIGNWTIDLDRSDDPNKALKGKLRKGFSARTKRTRRHPGSRRSAPEATMDSYWETIRENEERKASKNLRRLGPAFLLLTFEKVKISTNPETADEILVSYADSPSRSIKPNNDGRIFSAKGTELTQSYFGHTLAYIVEDKLVLETDAPDGGKFLEKIRLLNDSIYYEIVLDSLVLKETVTITRVFVKD